MSDNKFEKLFPYVLRLLWEKRNELFSESKKMRWVLDKRGGCDFVAENTYDNILNEIEEYDRAIRLLNYPKQIVDAIKSAEQYLEVDAGDKLQ